MIRVKLAIVLALIPTLSLAEPRAPKVTIGGYLETYYQVNLRFPADRTTNLRGFDGRDRTFTISNAVLDAKGEHGPLAARLVLQIGETPTIYYGAEQDWKYIQQATLAYTTHDTLIEAGLFPSPIGPEVFPIKDNWNWSRSDLFYGLPFYHTGARVSHPLGGGWTATAHVYNGWSSVVDTNDSPSVAASLAYASKRATAQLLYFGGIETATWRNLFDGYAQLAATDELSVLAHVDGGFDRDTTWIASALAAKYSIAKHVFAAARGDVFDQRGAQIFFPTPWIASATATLAWQIDGLSVRLEYRHDHAKTDAFSVQHHTRDTLTLGATAWF